METQQEPTPDQQVLTSDKKPISRFGQVSKLLQERWPEYILEIAVIIFSITISFALDEWKEKNRKQEVEQVYLRSLANDFDADINQLDEIIVETKQVIQKARALGALSTEQAAAKVNYNQILDDVRFVFKRPRFIAEDATFADLQSTGNMQLFTNYSLKRALFDYYKNYESISLVEAAELEATNGVAGPYLLKRLPLAKELHNKPVDLATVVGEIEFKNMMLMRQSTRDELLRDYEELLKQGKEIRTMLKQQIK